MMKLHFHYHAIYFLEEILKLRKKKELLTSNLIKLAFFKLQVKFFYAPFYAPEIKNPYKQWDSRVYRRKEGIRTLDTFPYTRFPSVRLKPLGHLSIINFRESVLKTIAIY